MSASLNFYQIDITLSVKAPVLSQSSGSLALGQDNASFMFPDNTPALPGTLVKGNLRHSWQALAAIGQQPDSTAIVKYLGTQSSGSGKSSHDPVRGDLFFCDVFTATGATSYNPRYRIRIDEAQGKVAKGALQSIDSPFATGKLVDFNGWVKALCSSAGEASELARLIQRGLSLAPALGAFKGIGFGQLKNVSVSCEKIVPDSIKVDISNSLGFGLRVLPDRPLCFAQHTLGNNSPDSADTSDDSEQTGLDNNFVSHSHIPGSAIKGSLCKILRYYTRCDKTAFPLFRKHIDDLRFTHAQPVDASNPVANRPAPLPLSVVRTTNIPKSIGGTTLNDYRYYDIRNTSGPGLVDEQVAGFSIDWKAAPNASESEAIFNTPRSPMRDIRIHTEISQETGASQDHQLYCTESVMPANYAGAEHCHWLGEVFFPSSLNRADKQIEKSALIAELEQILSFGLLGLGKTDAIAPVKSVPLSSLSSNRYTGKDTLSITLTTDAILLPPQTNQQHIENTNGNAKEHYRNAWHTISGGTLELINLFARQSLAGGKYWHHRFNCANNRRPYNPRILTNEGSVFVFRVKPGDTEEVKTLLDKWLAEGLPSHPDSIDMMDWRSNPWIAQNGWGDFSVDYYPVAQVGRSWKVLEEFDATA